MRGSRRSMQRRPHGGVGAVMYPDTYYDSDYGNYPDTYPDATSYPDYTDYGDYRDGGAGTRPGPRLPLLVHKTVILEGDFSYLLAGDPDVGSSLFESVPRDDRGRPVGVLPALLNQGWLVAKMLPADPKGRVTILLQRRVPAGE